MGQLDHFQALKVGDSVPTTTKGWDDCPRDCVEAMRVEKAVEGKLSLPLSLSLSLSLSPFCWSFSVH